MDLIVARQPVLDLDMQTWGYELLFRDGVENAFCAEGRVAPDGDKATLSVLNSAFFSGLSNLTGNNMALVNFTRPLLISGYAEILPKENVIIEILETVKPDDEVIEACYKLKSNGYRLALDDFQYSPEMEQLLAIADIVKVDFMQTGVFERIELSETLLSLNIELLAEKVETTEDYNQARELGFKYFQGYFFSKPQIINREAMPQSRVLCLQLLKEVNRSEINVDVIEEIIKGDPGLTMRMLRYLNSAFFGFRNKITSIKQAILMLGQKNLRKWATILAITTGNEHKPPELLKQALFRARFCEMLGETKEDLGSYDDYFIVGLLSLVEALLDQPKEDIFSEMALNEEMLSALNGAEGTLLSDSLRISESIEHGAWELVNKLVSVYGINDGMISEAYQEALYLADSFMEKY